MSQAFIRYRGVCLPVCLPVCAQHLNDSIDATSLEHIKYPQGTGLLPAWTHTLPGNCRTPVASCATHATCFVSYFVVQTKENAQEIKEDTPWCLCLLPAMSSRPSHLNVCHNLAPGHWLAGLPGAVQACKHRPGMPHKIAGVKHRPTHATPRVCHFPPGRCLATVRAPADEYPGLTNQGRASLHLPRYLQSHTPIAHAPRP